MYEFFDRLMQHIDFRGVPAEKKWLIENCISIITHLTHLSSTSLN